MNIPNISKKTNVRNLFNMKEKIGENFVCLQIKAATIAFRGSLVGRNEKESKTNQILKFKINYSKTINEHKTV